MGTLEPGRFVMPAKLNLCARCKADALDEGEGGLWLRPKDGDPIDLCPRCVDALVEWVKVGIPAGSYDDTVKYDDATLGTERPEPERHSMRRCSNCRWLDHDPRTKIVGEQFIGQCRRNAPRPSDNNEIRRTWPFVRSGDWCGEFLGNQ